MMRRARGLVAAWGGAWVFCVVLISGCARPPLVLEEEPTRTEVTVAAPVAAAAPARVEMPEAASAGVLRLREIKVIDDNGQHAVFAKLSAPPTNVTHFTLAKPNRLVVEMDGRTAGGVGAAQYVVDDPVIRKVGVGTSNGKVKFTITLADGELPGYTVNDLNDTLVVFFGEPRGTAAPIREQIVFTERALPGTVAPPAPTPLIIAEPAPPGGVSPEAKPVPSAAPVAAVEPVEIAEPEPESVAITAAPVPVQPPPAPLAAPVVPKALPVPVPPPPTAAVEVPHAAAPSAASAAPVHEPASRLHGAAAGLADQGVSAAPGKLYYGQQISLDLKSADIHNVLRLLAEVSKLNIVATDDVSGKITLRLFDVPWDQALDIILQVMSLESTREGNVLRVSTVKRLREEREELLKAQEARQEVEPLQVVYIRVNYAKAKKLAELISGAARVGGTSGGRGRGGGGGRGGSRLQTGVLTVRGSVMVDEFTNTLVVRDVAIGIQNARHLAHRLDIQIPQVLIESNIVEATTNFARDLGVQWAYSASVGPLTGNPTGFNFPGSVGLGGSGLGVGAGGLPFIADFPAGGNFAAGSGSALDLSLGSLDGTQSLNVRLSALEEEGKAKIISRPRVVTLNNVAATIKSLTVIRVRLPSTGTVINTGAGGTAGSATAGTEKIETGIVLTVTPQVSSDGYVRLDMFAKSSQADFSRTVDNIPTEITRETTSHVLVRDGQTVVLGGIYRDTYNDTRSGVPFLNHLPGLSWLFRNSSNSSRREDLLLFLTPRILGSTGAMGGLPSGADLWRTRNDGGRG